MLGNEFYVGAYKDGATWRINKFADVPQFPWAYKKVQGQNSRIQTSFEAIREIHIPILHLHMGRKAREGFTTTCDIDMQPSIFGWFL
ncbi:unnamed protein product [Ilex paraguariensis]|uniref:Uncharacterized protein n=1 Tax=Ilex paraguariensis TaxID=185542 RepID=A0ABC8S6I6_9AQUA